MAFPTTSVLDTFTRADENPVASGWSGPMFTGEQQLQVTSQQLRAPSGGGNSYWSSSTFGADTEVYCTIPAQALAGAFLQLFARTTNIPTSPQCYMARLIFASGNDTVRLFRRVGGVSTQLGADITTEDFALNDKFGLEVIGTNVSAYRYTAGSWTQIGTRSDSNISGTGSIGLEWTDNVGRADDFGGGTVVVGGGGGGGGANAARMTMLGVG